MKTNAPIVIQGGERTKNQASQDLDKGIFISDAARESLNIAISDQEFQALKQHVNQDSDKEHKCYITNQWYKASEGLFVPKTLMADALERNIESSDKVWSEFNKDKVIICPKCGKRFNYSSKEVLCPYCDEYVKVKKYGKKIKLPASKRLAFKLYIKYLRGRTRG